MRLTKQTAPFEVIEGGRHIKLQRAKEAYNLWRAGRTEREIANRMDLPRPAVMPLVLEGQEIDFERRVIDAFKQGRRSLLNPPPATAAKRAA
jgi:hypothetical protein